MICAKCRLCGRGEARLVKKEKLWSILECKYCGYVYLNPLPDEIFLNRHYQNYLPSGQIEIHRWQLMMTGVFKRSLALIGRLYGCKRGKLLDIGCGYGFFLEKAKEAGWDACGIDICQHAVKFADSRSLNVVSGSLLEKHYADSEFDIITMLYVLEHLPDPGRYLREVYRILKPNGILLLRVPHTTPIIKILKLLHIPNKLYDAPSHLSDFSPATIKMVLRDAGFTDIQTHIGGTTYPYPLYKTMISVIFGYFAELLYAASFKKYLLPGVSKTTVARHP